MPRKDDNCLGDQNTIDDGNDQIEPQSPGDGSTFIASDTPDHQPVINADGLNDKDECDLELPEELELILEDAGDSPDRQPVINADDLSGDSEANLELPEELELILEDAGDSPDRQPVINADDLSGDSEVNLELPEELELILKDAGDFQDQQVVSSADIFNNEEDSLFELSEDGAKTAEPSQDDLLAGIDPSTQERVNPAVTPTTRKESSTPDTNDEPDVLVASLVAPEDENAVRTLSTGDKIDNNFNEFSFSNYSLNDLLAQQQSEAVLHRSLLKRVDSSKNRLGEQVIMAYHGDEIPKNVLFSSVLTQERQIDLLLEKRKDLASQPAKGFAAKVKLKAADGILLGKIKIEEANLKKLFKQLGTAVLASEQLDLFRSATTRLLVDELKQAVEEIVEIELRLSRLQTAISNVQRTLE